MPTNVKVCINGFVLSTLLFDCNNNSGDQEGFLYGSVTRNVRREISDQSMCNTQEDILISVCSSVPFGSVLSFYNNVGEINRDALSELGERVENIVGWYRFRRNSPMGPSAREHTVHKNLRAIFACDSSVDHSQFIFGLLSSTNVTTLATHAYDYSFFIQSRDNTFRNLPFTILNLGDTRNSYRSGSMALPFMNSSSFNSVLSSSWNFTNFYETENQIHQFHQKLRNKLESLQEELAASDAVNASLEDDIRKISDEMQTLLATQECLANAAATTVADKEEEELNKENINEENEATKASGSKDELKDQVEEKDEGANEKESTEVDDRETSKKSYDRLTLCEKEVRKIISVSIKKVVSTKKVEATTSPEGAATESEDSSNSNDDPMIDRESETTDPLEGIDDDFNTTGSSEREETVASPSLKRVCSSPLVDDRSMKRVCRDKYFENGDYLDSTTTDVNKMPSSVNLEDTAMTEQQYAVDSDDSEVSSVLNQSCDLKSGITSGEIEDIVPSPGDIVEIVISDEGFQTFGQLIVCESVSSSEELSDKESDAKGVLLNVQESLVASAIKRSLSDGAISSQKKIATGRCESAHAELLTGSDSKYDEIFIPQAGDSNTCRFGESSSRVNAPLIIYAVKDQSKDNVPSIPESNEQTDESKLEGSSADKRGVERNQSSPSCSQIGDQKKDVP